MKPGDSVWGETSWTGFRACSLDWLRDRSAIQSCTGIPAALWCDGFRMAFSTPSPRERFSWSRASIRNGTRPYSSTAPDNHHAPNPRLQRTPLRAPLSRKPLGSRFADWEEVVPYALSSIARDSVLSLVQAQIDVKR